MKKAVLLLAKGFEEVEAVTPWDFLRRAGVEVFAAGIGGRRITGSHGITLEADGLIEDFSDTPDCVVIPGGMPGASNIAGSPGAMELIRRVHEAGGLVAAVCAAPGVVLGKTGILEGRKATCYPGYEKHFPEGARFSEERVVRDGNLITSRGAGTAAEFALEIVRVLEGPEAAEKIRKGTLQPV